MFLNVRRFKCIHEGSQGKECVSSHCSAHLPAFRQSSIQRRYLSTRKNKISSWRCQEQNLLQTLVNEDNTANGANFCAHPARIALTGGRAARDQCWGPKLTARRKRVTISCQRLQKSLLCVAVYQRLNYTTNKCVQGWMLEKADEFKGMFQSKAVVTGDQDRVILKSCLNSGGTCSDMVQLDCFM